MSAPTRPFRLLPPVSRLVVFALLVVAIWVTFTGGWLIPLIILNGDLLENLLYAHHYVEENVRAGQFSQEHGDRLLARNWAGLWSLIVRFLAGPVLLVVLCFWLVARWLSGVSDKDTKANR